MELYTYDDLPIKDILDKWLKSVIKDSEIAWRRIVIISTPRKFDDKFYELWRK